MTKTTITEQYILVETDDIDFSVLRLAAEEFTKRSKPVNYAEEITEILIEEL